MHTLASASALLDNITGIDSTSALLAELGFANDLVALDTDHLARLGLDARLGNPHIARGDGALCALTFTVAEGADVRSTISQTAHNLSLRTPHLLWIIVAIADTGEIAIATWHPGTAKPRVAALVAHRGRIVDSDSETVCALAASHTASDLLTHHRWLEILGRQSVSRSFFRCLQHAVADMAHGLNPAPPAADAGELALIYTSRLIFLCFLETKGWLNRDHGFLANNYADCMMKGGRYHERVLAPLFFGTLNTLPRNRAPRAISFGKVPFLNGGLFARSPLERTLRHSHFTDESLGDLFANLLTRYRFTAREDTTTWSEAAIDPEMLGKSFESLMASSERKTTGAFYTPQPLVNQLTTSGLANALSSQSVEIETVTRALTGEIPGEAARSAILDAITRVRILDPSCGSGAFLVHALEQLSSLSVRLGDIRPLHAIRRTILTSSIFGVDINPMAVWLCELRLWLSMAIEDPERDPMRVRPLPNLDRHIRVGDSLSGGAFHNRDSFHDARRLATARMRYSRAAGPRKRSLARALDRSERACATETLDGKIRSLTRSRLDLITAARSRDLFGERLSPPAQILASLTVVRASIRNARRKLRALARGGALPFSFQTHFADVGATGGFDLVTGNPPWVRTHNLEPVSRIRFRREFWVFRHAAWATGARSAAASSSFASQVDLAALFVERSVRLTRPSGAIALLIPAKLWRSLAGGGLRAYLTRHTRIAEIHDLTESPQLFDAAVYPSLMVAVRDEQALPLPSHPVRSMGFHTFPALASEPPSDTRDAAFGHAFGHAFVHRNRAIVRWPLNLTNLCFDSSPGSPWLLLPPEVRAAFDRVTAAGLPLSRSVIGRPLLGVKTGCNDAFVVSSECHDSNGDLSTICSAGRSGEIEKTSLRPLLRGDAVSAWHTAPVDSRIVWTHDGDGSALHRLPPHTRKWLGHWRRRLERRTDACGKERWWMLFRTESANASSPRVIWSDIGKVPRAVAIAAGDTTVPLNTCYVARCRDMTDAHAFAALLNSPVSAAWLNAIAEPARGGYSRYLGWTMALLPTPLDWTRARRIMAPIGREAAAGRPPPAHRLVSATLDAFQIADCDVEALMTWNAR